MAQTAPKKRALLGIKFFWERPTLEPQLRWKRRRIVLKLIRLANEGISIDMIREAKPDKVTPPPPELVYEEDVYNSTVQSERYRRIRDEPLKKAWLNKCQKIEATRILCGDRAWRFGDTKTVSLTCLSLGTEDPDFWFSRTNGTD